MTALQVPRVRLEVVPDPEPAPGRALAPVRTPEHDRPTSPLPARAARAPEYDWPASPALELWALRLRLEALCSKGESREGWVSCRVLRRTMAETAALGDSRPAQP